MKTHANLKKYFCLGLFWFKYIFAIKFKIRILDLILCRKNSVSFEGQYYSTKVINLAFCLLGANFVVCLMIFTKRLDPDHAWSGTKPFDTLTVFLEYIFQKDGFEKKKK